VPSLGVSAGRDTLLPTTTAAARLRNSQVRTGVQLRIVTDRGAVQVPSGRPKHPVKELEAGLKEAEELQGWRVDGGGRTYFRLRCPCGKHMR
jgi:hypothetical protein